MSMNRRLMYQRELLRFYNGHSMLVSWPGQVDIQKTEAKRHWLTFRDLSLITGITAAHSLIKSLTRVKELFATPRIKDS